MFIKITTAINDVLWSTPMLVLCIVAGIVFTIILRGVQVRKIPAQLKLLFNGQASEKGMSSFQAFCLAIAGRVGVGNIAGVATAIAAGGPGALFWMWIMALLGASTSFIECTMAQLYKGEIDGQYRGGIAYYLAHGLKIKFLGYFYAVVMVVAELALFGIQSHEISSSASNGFHIPPIAVGIALVLLLGIIIFGGAKRIAAVANVVVPFMAIAYCIIAIIILLVNIKNIPDTFAMIFESAFGVGPIAGGMMGTAVMWGVRRGVYSNEAGMATATQSAAAAEVSHPVKQGLVQCFSVYVDTLFVCTATGLMLISTGSYNVIAPNGGYLVHNLDIEAGTMWTQAAVNTLLPVGAQFVAVSLFFFAFTTIINMSYNCETAFSFFFEGKSAIPKSATYVIRALILITVFIGTVIPGSSVWALGDLGCGMLVWGNIICLFFLAPKAAKLLRDFENQQKQGADPVFNPKDFPELGNLPLWEKAHDGYKSGNLKA